MNAWNVSTATIRPLKNMIVKETGNCSSETQQVTGLNCFPEYLNAASGSAGFPINPIRIPQISEKSFALSTILKKEQKVNI